MLILNVDKISKNFGYGQLFDNLSFPLNEWESFSIVGTNGCGKSTLVDNRQAFGLRVKLKSKTIITLVDSRYAFGSRTVIQTKFSLQAFRLWCVHRDSNPRPSVP